MQLTAAAVTPPAEHVARRPAGAADTAAADAGVRRTWSEFMIKKRRGANAKATARSAVIGAAWYRREQWIRLLEIASDRDTLESTYAEWESNAEKALLDFSHRGVQVRKVYIDIDELISWCRANGCPIDAKARASFTAEKLQERDRNRRGNRDV